MSGRRAAGDIEARAAEWIRRKEFGEWSDAAESEFQAWLAQSVLHRVAFLRMDEGWNRTARLAALRPSDPERTAQMGSRFSWTMLFRIAAAVFVIGAFGVAGEAYLRSISEDVYTTPVGGREILTLFDRSHVELNTDTVLRLSRHQRIATLVKGEAFFQIRHDAKNPFVVMASGQRITDLGTQFSVRDDTGKLEVSLLEGRAKIENTGAAAHASILAPGDMAIATADTLSVTHKPVQLLANTIGWRRGLVIFRHMALADAAEEFNRYNMKKLIVDRKVANLTIDGTFATDNLETFARVTRIALGLHVESLDREIVISR